ncbi:MAG: hypothetical protein AB1489_08260 [Acidobacteriota bacterium]
MSCAVIEPANTTAPLAEQSEKDGWLGSIIVVLATLSIFAYTAVALLDTGRGKLLIASIGTMALSGLIYFAIRALAPSIILPRIIVLSYTLQLFWLTLIVALDLPTAPLYNDIAPDISEYPLLATLPSLIIPIGTLCGTLLFRLFQPEQKVSPIYSSAIDAPPADLNWYLVFAALIQLLYWPATMESAELAGYLIRVLSQSFILVPFFAGRFANRLPWVRFSWIIVMSINAIIGLVVGARGVALIPLGLFILGIISSLRGQARKRATLIVVVASIPIFLISGVVGTMRDQIGRGGLELFSIERATQVIESIPESLTSVPSTNNAEIAIQGLGRMLIWTNIVIPVMSPSLVPYREFTGIEEEIKLSLQISNLAGLSRDDLYDAGLSSAPANSYGFTVNSGNSVEFGLLADGWSRGGPFIALLFGLVATLLLATAEVLLRKLWEIMPAAAILLLAIAMKSAFETSAVPLLGTVRALILNIGFFLAIALAIYLFRGNGEITKEE